MGRKTNTEYKVVTFYDGEADPVEPRGRGFGVKQRRQRRQRIQKIQKIQPLRHPPGRSPSVTSRIIMCA